MRIFSSRCGTIRRSSPALALTRPMSACSIEVGCLHHSDYTLWAWSHLFNSRAAHDRFSDVACAVVFLRCAFPLQRSCLSLSLVSWFRRNLLQAMSRQVG